MDPEKKLTPLMVYALLGWRKQAQKLLGRGADVDAINDSGRTALMIACVAGQKEMVKFLLQKNAKLEVADFQGKTALIHAIDHAQEAIAIKLIEQGAAGIHIKDKSGKDVLWLAALRGLTKVVRLLIKKGAKVSSADHQQWKQLMLGCQFNRFEIIKLLVLNGGETLKTAARHGRKQNVKILLKANANVDQTDKSGCTALFAAARNGHFCVVKELINNGASVNIANKNGQTPLWVSALSGFPDIVEELIVAKADVDVADNNGYTPLMCASQNGHTRIVEILLDANPDNSVFDYARENALCIAVRNSHSQIIKLLLKKYDHPYPGMNMKDVNGRTIFVKANDFEGTCPIHRAAYAGHRQAVEAFLHSGASVNAVDSRKRTVLTYATYSGNADLLSFLIDSGSEINQCDADGWTPLMYCTQSEYTECMNVLLTKNADAEAKNSEGDSALHICCAKGHTEAVRLLLDHHANVNIQNNKGFSPLMLSVENGHKDIVNYLLHDYNSVLGESLIKLELSEVDGDDTALIIASKNGRTEMARLLVQKGASVNICDKNANTPLWHAARNGHTPTTEPFVGKNTDIDVSNHKKVAPLSISAQMGHTDIVNYLIQNVADINSVDSDGIYPIHIAAYAGHRQTVEALLHNGASVDVVDTEKRTLLICAAYSGNADLLSFLIESGSGINQCDGNGWTPLMYCTSYGHTECLRVLLTQKADTDAVNSDGDSALHICCAKGHKESVRLLLDHHANLNIQNNKGFSPLMLGIKNGHTDTVSYLLHDHDGVLGESLINLELSEVDGGDTALIIASRKGYGEIVKALLERGANVNAVNAKNSSALEEAVQFEHLDIHQRLLDNGAGVSLGDNDEDMPLLSTLLSNNETVTKTPLDQESDVRESNPNGEIALLWGAEEGSLILVKILLSKGGYDNQELQEALEAAKWKGRDDIAKAIQDFIMTQGTITAGEDTTPSPQQSQETSTCGDTDRKVSTSEHLSERPGAPSADRVSTVTGVATAPGNNPIQHGVSSTDPVTASTVDVQQPIIATISRTIDDMHNVTTTDLLPANTMEGLQSIIESGQAIVNIFNFYNNTTIETADFVALQGATQNIYNEPDKDGGRGED